MTGGKVSVALTVLAAGSVLLGACSTSQQVPDSSTPGSNSAPASPSDAGVNSPEDPSAPNPAEPSEPDSPAKTTTSKAPTPLPEVFDHAKMQDAVHDVLTTSYKIKKVGVVTCPRNKPVKKDTKFDCTAEIGKSERSVEITVTSNKGNYDVARPEKKKASSATTTTKNN